MAQRINHAALMNAVGKDFELDTRPVPKPGPKDVLIRTRAVSINPADKMRQVTGFGITTLPWIMGANTAGTVEEVGSEVEDAFKVGDRVISLPDGFRNGDNDRASFQSYTLSAALATAKLPDNISFLEGSTVPAVLGTAAVALFDAFKLPIPGTASTADTPAPPPGSILLVWGGATSVGAYAIQLARLLGLTVFATASPRHHARLREYGASVVVDYSQPEVAVQELVAAAQKAGNKPIAYGFATITDADKTVKPIEEVLQKTNAAAGAANTAARPKIVYIGFLADGHPKVAAIDYQFSTVGEMFSRRQDVARWLFQENLTKWLQDGTIVPLPTRLVPGGLSNIQEAVNLVQGVSGEKLVVEFD